MWPFKKKAPQINGPSNIGFDDTFMGIAYRGVHRDTPQPDPGAGSWAWNTLALPAFTPIGPGVHAISQRVMPLGPAPMIAQQGAIVVGIPTTAGQYIHQPLLNPLTGN